MVQQVVILDSTQIEAYDTCPTMWYNGYRSSLELIQDQEDENNSLKAIRMGTLGHKWLEIFYTHKAMGCSTTSAVNLANAFDPDLADELDLHQFPLDKDQRKTVIERMQFYWMKYANDDFQPACRQDYDISVDANSGLPIDGFKKVPLVERGFSYELFNSPEYLFILEGRIDLIAPIGNSTQLGFVDHKLQLRERQLYPKSIQFKNYALATGLNYGIINYIRLHQTVSAKTLVRQLISFNSFEIRTWRSELIEIYVNVAKDLKAGDPKWAFARKRSQCSGKFGYTCQFAHICEEPDREVGELIKLQRYKTKQEWKPW